MQHRSLDQHNYKIPATGGKKSLEEDLVGNDIKENYFYRPENRYRPSYIQDLDVPISSPHYFPHRPSSVHRPASQYQSSIDNSFECKF